VLPDLEVQSDCCFCIDCGVSGNEVHSFSDTVDDYHDCDVVMHLGKLHNKVNTNEVDTAHIVSINGIFTSIQYSGEINQVSAVLMYFS
jgi:hypothetical protein